MKIDWFVVYIFLTIITIMGFFYISFNTSSLDYYQSSAIQTCEYANNLTNIINSQSALLELVLNKSEKYVRLDKLDCGLLK